MIYFPPIGWGPTGKEPIQTRGDGYSHYAHPDGSSWVYLNHWSDALERMLHESRVPCINISEYWTAPTLDALRPHFLRIQELAVDSIAVTDLSALAEMPALHRLQLHHSSAGAPFASLRNLTDCTLAHPATMGSVHEAPALERLELVELPLRDLRAVGEMTTLRSLAVSGKHKMSLSGIESMRLDALNLRLRRLESLAPMTGLSLRRLELHETRKLGDLESVGGMTSLESLDLEQTAAPASLSFLRELSALQRFYLEEVTPTDETVSLRSLLDLRNLRELELLGGKHSLRNLRDIEVLGEMDSLEKIRLHNGPKEIDSIGWVRGLPRLRTFWLNGTEIRDGDVSPLLELPHIDRVMIVPTAKHYSHTDASFDLAMQAHRATRLVSSPA